MKYLSLFSGVGGFELGIKQAYETTKGSRLARERECDSSSQGGQETKYMRGVSLSQDNGNLHNDVQGKTSEDNLQCIGFSEIDKYAISIYQKHFPEHKNYGSVRDIDAEQLPDFNLLVGGFPCQAFSIAGKRKGFEDARGTLFYDIARIAKTKQPMFMLLENVKGLVSHDKGKTLEVILESLQELGYYVNYEIRNSKDYGVPQNRERIFFLCKHIKLLSSVGQNEKITTSENIIQEWLFQLLLNNLAEVKKLQEHSSKDWVVGYLLLKEINQNLNQSEENILDGISAVMAEKSSLFEVNPWQSIDTWLSKNLAENFSEVNKYTISTAINEIIESKTYSFSAMLKSILLATVLLRKSSENLWKKTLLDLILIQENTKYARINNKGEEIIVTESGITHISSELQDFEKYFIVGHLRGTSRPEVFPITGTDTEDNESGRNRSSEHTQTVTGQGGLNARGSFVETAYALDSSYYKGTNTIEKSRRQLIGDTLQYKGLCDKLGIYASTQETNAIEILSVLQKEIGTEAFAEWGLGILDSLQTEEVLQPILYGKGVRHQTDKSEPNVDDSSLPRKEDLSKESLLLLWKSKNRCSPQEPRLARQFTRELSESLSKLSQQDTQVRIRRLTPTEAERLQGFPDQWTEGVSDTQRYKVLGNAVSVPVIKAIMEKLIPNFDLQ